MSIGGLVPLPSDALVTPVTFRVRKRRLRGMLEPFDSAETGRRELSGEWVVGKKTWQRLQAEWKARQLAQRSESQSVEHKKTERVVLYIHGGTKSSQFQFFVFGISYTHSRCLLFVQCSCAKNNIYPTR